MVYWRQRLGNPPDLVVRPVAAGDGPDGQPHGWAVFLDGMADVRLVTAVIVRPLTLGLPLGGATPGAPGGLGVHAPQLLQVSDPEVALGRILDGWTAVVPAQAVGGAGIWLADTSGRPSRSVEEPDSETGVRVPREGFNEVLDTSMALVRTRIRDPHLRFELRRVGMRTHTRVVLAYVDGVIDPQILQTVRSRLDRIQVDAVLESGYIEEFIEDSPYSPFPQTLRTERPDVVAANLLEGRFAVLVDGTPFALVGPVVFWQMLTVAEDYYERFIIGSLLRLLRIAAFLISLTLPGLYVAVTTYHQEMIPTDLLLSIAAAREGVPFPAVVEALVMEFNFELLREAGVRLPRAVGSAVSIVGALVLGQAAISANLVSPAMVIVVAITAIGSFATPVFSMAIAARMIRFVFVLVGALMGLFGIQTVAVLLAVHLCALRSFGVPYLAPVAPAVLGDWRDLVLRSPWWAMRGRPRFLLPEDPRRAPEPALAGPAGGVRR